PGYLVEETFEGGPFTDGSITVRETVRGPLTKISFAIGADYENTLSVEGNVVRLQLRSSDYHPASLSQMKRLATETAALERKLVSSERERQALARKVAGGLSENQALQSRFEVLEQRRRSLEMGLSKALSEFSRLEQVLGERDPDANVAQAADAAPACAAASETIAQLQSALADYASSRYNLANELGQVSSERDSLESQLSRLRGNSSSAREPLTSTVLQPSEPPHQSLGQPSSSVLATTSRATNLRSAPSKTSSPLALLASDISVEVLEVSEDWVQVRWESQLGWIPRGDLHLDDQ
ncbi:MAG: SH3 domain-containing protein, partial [Thermoanaerobaculia bacterium]